MTDRLLQLLNTIVSLTEAEEQAFVGITTTRRLQKKEWLMRHGDICRMVTFIHSGSLRLFHTVDGEEKTIQFFFENALYTDYLSFLTEKPTIENVEAMEACELVQFSRVGLEQLYRQHPVFE